MGQIYDSNFLRRTELLCRCGMKGSPYHRRLFLRFYYHTLSFESSSILRDLFFYLKRRVFYIRLLSMFSRCATFFLVDRDSMFQMFFRQNFFFDNFFTPLTFQDCMGESIYIYIFCSHLSYSSLFTMSSTFMQASKICSMVPTI